MLYLLYMNIGAHVSASGGYENAIHNIVEIGGACVQLFSSPPQQWKDGNPSDDDINRFVYRKNEYAISPVYFHASYLINLAGSAKNQEKSINALVSELTLASRIGARGSVVHLGSFGDKDASGEARDFNKEKYSGLIQNIQNILDNTPSDTYFIIENMGMRKVGRTLEEIGYIVKAVNNKRIKVCLDTCHLHAAGYDISTQEKLAHFLELFDSYIGRDVLELWHVNDSKDEFGDLRDRHENIGKGYVGIDVFRTLFHHSEMKDLPFIAEVPGFNGNGPDKQNIDALRTCAN